MFGRSVVRQELETCQVRDSVSIRTERLKLEVPYVRYDTLPIWCFSFLALLTNQATRLIGD